MTQALYRKWRPQKWAEVVGQEHIVQTLRNAIAANRVAHAYLFPGPRGTGKTTTARLLAKAVNCLDPDLAHRPCDQCAHCLAVNQGRFLDLIEIDAASNTSVDDIRDLRDKINFSPNQGQYKVYIIDEVHMLSTAAFNALLKTLEEPPPHAIFILATTEAHKIPATVLSRCQRHEFRRIPSAEIARQLRMISDAEKFDVDEEALQLVARQATGSMRDAISLLDQLASTGGRITGEAAREVLGTATSQTVLDVMDALAARQPSTAFDSIHNALDAGTDARQLARQVVDYLRQVLLVQYQNANLLDLPPEIRARLAEHAQAFTPQVVLHAIKMFTQAANELRSAWQPSLPLELSFIEALETPQPGAVSAAPAQAPVSGATARRTVSEHTARQNPPAAQTTAAPEAEEPGDAPGQEFSLRHVQKEWKHFLSDIRDQNKSTQALLNSCSLLELRGQDLFVGFPSEVVKTKMEKEDHMKIAQDTLKKIFNREIRLRCVIAAENQKTLPPEVEGDGIVAAALRLGGEIVDSREIKPRKKQ